MMGHVLDVTAKSTCLGHPLDMHEDDDEDDKSFVRPIVKRNRSKKDVSH